MAVQSPYLLPGMNPAAVVQNPAQNQITDTGLAPLSVGRQGDLLNSTVHGQYGVMSHRGAGFYAGTTTAAFAIPVNTTTSGSTFAINNPAGSGKNAELVRFKLDFLHTNAAPTTANVVGWSFVQTTTNAASAITKIADPVTAGGHAVNLGGGSPVASVCSAITFASALTVAANWGIPMFSFPASWVPTVGGYPVPLFYDFMGTCIVPPGWSLTLTASTAWGANTVVPSLSWIEYYP